MLPRRRLLAVTNGIKFASSAVSDDPFQVMAHLFMCYYYNIIHFQTCAIRCWIQPIVQNTKGNCTVRPATVVNMGRRVLASELEPALCQWTQGRNSEILNLQRKYQKQNPMSACTF